VTIKRPLRILLATPFLTEPPDFGAVQRSNLMHRALCALGEVDIVAVLRHVRMTDGEEAALPGVARLVDVLRPAWPQPRPPLWLRGVRRLRPSLGNTLVAERAALEQYHEDPDWLGWWDSPGHDRRYDLVVGRHLAPLCRLGAFGRATTVLDLDDAPDLLISSHMRAKRGASGARLVQRARIHVHRREILRCLKRCAHVWFASESDRARLPAPSGSVLRNIPFHGVRDLGPPVADAPTLLFVGQLRYPPNRLGVQHFLEHVWPAVIEHVPNARIRLVGETSPEDLIAWNARAGVDAVGRVASLEEHYTAATACIAPIRFGAGTNIKVLEAAAHGRPTVLTSFAHRGYERHLEHEREILRADGDPEFAAHCVALLRDPARALAMGSLGRAVVAHEFSFENFARTVAQGVSIALGHRPATDEVGAAP
jgi:glycosyltransferase involved in cell wall biosynthesis